MITENTTRDEQLNTKLSKNSTIKESQFGSGYLTVIKNAGKSNEEVICKDVHNVLTAEGTSWVHDQCYIDNSGQTGGARYIGLSNDGSFAPDRDDTRTSWEAVEENSNGLVRANADSAVFNAGVSSTYIATSTIVKTFTCDTGAVAGIRVSSLLNNTRASGTSILVHSATFTSVDLEVDDTLQVTWVITLY